MKRTLLVLSLLTAACTPVTAQRGNLLEDYQVGAVQPGVSTRSEVLRNLGSPTTQSTFDSAVWYYIGQETEKRGILDPEIVEERIFLIAFNDDGVVEHFEEVDRARIAIPFERSKTPTHGNERTIAQELLGNLGKFNPQDQGSAASTAGGF